MPSSPGINNTQRSMNAIVERLNSASEDHRVHLRGDTLYARHDAGTFGDKVRNFFSGIKDYLFGGQAQRAAALTWVRDNLTAKYPDLNQSTIDLLFRDAGIKDEHNTITVGQLRTLNAEAQKQQGFASDLGVPTVEEFDEHDEIAAMHWNALNRMKHDQNSVDDGSQIDNGSWAEAGESTNVDFDP